MSESKNTDLLAKQRLLKANNVQRRRFEKLANEVIVRAERKHAVDISDQKAVKYNEAVEKAMGGELAKLLKIRKEIQQHKQAIEKLQKIGDIRRRLNKRGIACKSGDEWPTGYRGRVFGNFEYYLDPPVVDEKSEDVCERVVGNPQVQLRLMDCPNNAPYAKYLESISSLEADKAAFAEACEALQSDIWAVVTTEDIQAKLTNFKQAWL